MDYYQFPDGHVQGFDNPIADQIAGATKISAEQFAQEASAPSPEQIRAQFVASAQALLDYTTGQRGQFSRAQVAGLLANDTRLAPWQTYVQALRAIVNGTDTTSTALPTQPAYIEGT